MSKAKDYISIEALFDESLGPNLAADPRPALRKADVIIGHDIMSGHEFILYGRKTLERIARGESEPGNTSFIRIGLDQETDDLEKIIVLVQAVKGSHDYVADGESAPRQVPLMEATVRVYDFEAGRLTTIPASELAPGMVRAKVEGVEGEVWVDASQVKPGGEYRHPPFTDEQRESLLKPIQETFSDVRPLTIEEWEDGFRRDIHMNQEIAAWLSMARYFNELTGGRVLRLDQKQEIFQVLLACVNNGPGHVLTTMSPRTLSRKRVKEIVEGFLNRRLSDESADHS